MYRRNSSPPDAIYGTVLPNDGLYVNPMRNGFHTPPSPSGSVSSESFYLHNPQEVIYNRVKDLFDSDGSQKDGSVNGGHQNALTVQAQVHSSSSGAGSGSEESLSGSSVSEIPPVLSKRTNSSNQHNHEHHDYEDIYLVREEARGVSKGKFGMGRSRSRDSGSHSRSASASSAHSTDVILEYTTRVSLFVVLCFDSLN